MQHKALVAWVGFRERRPVIQIGIALVALLGLVLVARVLYEQVNPLTCDGISKNDYPEWSDEEFRNACNVTKELGY